MDVLRSIGINAQTPQTEKAVAGQVKNNAGGYTFPLTPVQRARRFLILGTDSNSFYGSAEKMTRENAESVIELAKTDPRALTELIVEVSTKGLAPKQDATLFAYAVAVSVPMTQADRLYALGFLNDICRTATMLFQWVGYVEQFRGHGRMLNGAIRKWYLSHEDGNAYQVVKYRQREGWSHRDVLRLVKPKPQNAVQSATFRFAIGKGLTSESAPIIQGFALVQDATNAFDVVNLIQQFNLPWEAVPTQWLNDPKVLAALFEKMPYNALVRQLPRFTNAGLLPPLGGVTARAIERLTDAEALRKARAHPLKLLIAQRTYQNGHGKGSTWTPNSRIVEALEKAFYDSFEYAPSAGKRTLIGLDVSGSMGSYCYGGDGYSSGLLKSCEIGAVMAQVIAKTEPESYIHGFATTFVDLGITPSMSLGEATSRAVMRNFGGTDTTVAIQYAIENHLEVDTFVIITDNDTWHGSQHTFQALRNYRARTGIDAKLAVLATLPSPFTIADPNDAGMLDIVGFSPDVPSLVTTFSKGL